MAAPGGRSPDRLIDLLERDPRSFSFHEAVRLIERWARGSRRSGEVGTQAFPDREAVRFKGDPSVAFPSTEIKSLTAPGLAGTAPEAPYGLTVSFLGLAGPLGVLPDFYTELIIQRGRLGDEALSRFLDIFVHRIVSLHYRAWKKYRLGPTIEHSFHDRREDPITTMLRSVMGYGLPSLHDRLAVSDSVLLRYGGQLAAGSRSASRLRDVLEAHFGFPVRVEELYGTWRYLPAEDRSCLPESTEPEGRYVTLGQTALLGRRVWDALGSFHLRLGPLTRGQYDRLLPGHVDARALADLVHAFTGPALSFDVALLIQRDQLPAARLAGPDVEPCHLGWNAWLGGGVGEDIAESVFALEPLKRAATI